MTVNLQYRPHMNPSQTHAVDIPRKIIDFHLDEFFDWVADLECGHQQHVRHNPPWTNRHWVTTPQGRLEHIGQNLLCVTCLNLPYPKRS